MIVTIWAIQTMTAACSMFHVEHLFPSECSTWNIRSERLLVAGEQATMRLRFDSVWRRLLEPSQAAFFIYVADV
jgi:hypothetical protein